VGLFLRHGSDPNGQVVASLEKPAADSIPTVVHMELTDAIDEAKAAWRARIVGLEIRFCPLASFWGRSDESAGLATRHSLIRWPPLTHTLI
jgi:hypothetical protein